MTVDGQRLRLGATIVAALATFGAVSCGGDNPEDDPRSVAVTYVDRYLDGDPAACELVTSEARRAAVDTAKAYDRVVEVDAGSGPGLEFDRNRSLYRGVETCGEAVSRSATLLADDQASIDVAEVFADATVEVDGEKATVSNNPEDAINRRVISLRRVDGAWRVDQLELAPPADLFEIKHPEMPFNQRRR